MSPRNKVFHAAPPSRTFDTSSDAKEPLIATGADAEKEDQGLEERALSTFKLSFLLLGLLISFFFHFSVLGASWQATESGWVGGGKHLVFGFGILWNLFTLTILVLIHNSVTIAYPAVGGHSKELLQDMIWQLQFHFGAGAVAGACLAWTTELLF